MKTFEELTHLDTGLGFEQHKDIVKRVTLGRLRKKLEWAISLLDKEKFLHENLSEESGHVSHSSAGDGWGQDNYYIEVFEGMSIIDTLDALKSYLTDPNHEENYYERLTNQACEVKQ